VAIGWAAIANDDVTALASKLLGGATGAEWGAAISAPVVEETLKAIGVATVILIGREFVHRPTHGMFIGAFCGLGFQLVENVLYVVQNAFNPVAASDLAATVPVVLVRVVTALDSHWLMTAMTGLGLGYALTRHDRSRARRLLVLVGLFGVAWWMHFFKDSPLFENLLPGPIGGVAKAIPNLILGFIVYRIAMRAEWRHYAAVVGDESSEVVTPTEVASMRTRRSRRRVRKRYHRHGGKGARQLARRLQRCQLQLANEVETDPGAAARTRATIRRLRSSLPQAGAGIVQT
jgi:protease PrsW